MGTSDANGQSRYLGAAQLTGTPIRSRAVMAYLSTGILAAQILVSRFSISVIRSVSAIPPVVAKGTVRALGSSIQVKWSQS